jgi:hypothetical protein
LKNEFRQVTNFATKKKKEKKPLLPMNHRHFGFFITQNCQKQRCWVRVTGGPPACIRSKQELWTRRSWRVLRHTTRPVSAPSGIVRPAREHSSSLRRYSHSLALSLPASLCLEFLQ